MRRRRTASHALPRSRRGSTARVSVGDRITVPSGVAGPERGAVIVEVQNGNGTPPYVVVWSDHGHRALFYPPSSARIERLTG